MTPRTKNLIAGLSLAGMLGGCATVAPTQLLEARDAYATSSNGLAAKLTPAELYDAKKVLDKANAEFDAHGDTPVLRDYAYIATRKVELADVKARTEADRQKIAEYVKQGVVVRDNQVKSTQAALASSRMQLKDERTANDAATTELKATNTAQGKELEKTTTRLEDERNANTVTTAELKATNTAQGKELVKTATRLEDERSANRITTTELRATNTAQGKELEKTAAQLDVEKQARITAEAKLAGAMKDLAAIAAVKEETRGVVITLSGSVLFASGKYALLDTAKAKLDQVAEALKAQSEDKKMLVEGHTDSQGSGANNQTLSLNRASAVRDYLVTRGVDANKISAVGMGSSRPLLDNKKAENRANNRRVEIVIQPSGLSAR
jgi:outer membrane protein OmpA-like peptidoglycan-associated protein